MKPVVLSLCDYSGVMVKPWAEAGYECWCLDLQHETGYYLAWSNCIKGARVFRHLWNGCMRASHEELQHPTQKPVALMIWILGLRWTPKGTILDPYMGSGTTLVAAKRLGRRAIGIEIEGKYCEIAARRVEDAGMPLFDPPAEQAQMLLRCDEEIAAIEARPDVHTAPAYLSTLGCLDWEMEKRLIQEGK